MTATDTPSETITPSPRLAEFQGEVDKLKVTGGKANPERVWVILSGIGMLVGVVISLFAWHRHPGHRAATSTSPRTTRWATSGSPWPSSPAPSSW